MISGLIQTLISLYMLMILVHAFMTWIPGMKGGPFELWLRMLTDPPQRPVRQLLEPIQRGTGIDFSPVVVLLALSVIRSLI
jgi:uncharacterized protein YggT (Ycf19 family)